jgi:hypothetical protein
MTLFQSTGDGAIVKIAPFSAFSVEGRLACGILGDGFASVRPACPDDEPSFL